MATDFDLTLVYEGFPPELYRALLKAIDSGISVGICSGRYWWDVRDILLRHGVDFGDPYPQFLICRHAFIYWIEKGKLREDIGWNNTWIEEIGRVTSEMSSYIGEWLRELRHAGCGNYVNWTLYHDYGFEVMYSTDGEAERARQIVARLIAEIPEVEVTRNYWGVNVTAACLNKGTTLEHVAGYLGLSPAQVLAIGDSLNDLPMLDGRRGFRSAAVANADESVKSAVLRNGGVVASERGGMGVLEIMKGFGIV